MQTKTGQVTSQVVVHDKNDQWSEEILDTLQRALLSYGLPPQLRDNLGNRLILRVESQGTSEIALGEKGAEKLLGKGHLAAKLSGEITYAQVPFLSAEEQVQVVEEIRRHSNV